MDCGMQCDLCRFWFHARCTDATKTLIEFLNSDEGQKSSIHWYCRACESGSRKLFEQMVKFDGRLSIVEKHLCDLGDKVDSLIARPISSDVEKSLNDLNEKVSSLMTRPSSSDVGASIQAQSLSQISREIEDRNRRKCNIIVYGLKEGEEKIVDEILSKIGDKVEKADEPVWLGKTKSGTSTKPLLVKLKTEKDKWNVITKARAITKEHYHGVFLNPDLSKTERIEQGLLRKELKSRRGRGEEVRIKNGSIIPIPKN